MLLHRHAVQQDPQQKRVLDLIGAGLQLVYVPVDPDELALEELGLGGGEPQVEVGREVFW